MACYDCKAKYEYQINCREDNKIEVKNIIEWVVSYEIYNFIWRIILERRRTKLNIKKSTANLSILLF